MTGTHDGTTPDINDDELFLGLGRAVAAGATLEWSLVELHATLLNSPRAVHALAGEGVDRARDGCLSMAHLLGPPIEDLVRPSVVPIKELWQQRNVLVHSAWLAGSHLGDPARSGVTIRRRRNGVDTDGWTVGSIGKLTSELGNRAEQLSDLVHHLESDTDMQASLARPPEPYTIASPRIW